MQRSLYNNLLPALVFLLFACGNGKNANTGGAADAPQRERGAHGDPQTAPAHNAPDQDRIDSLKREKQREKGE
ncbi:MAG: hypothetical protein KF905_12065 [Flavobacteriales bacterium]|nr:hypothetical protein [Flavobacteriales bacterium]